MVCDRFDRGVNIFLAVLQSFVWTSIFLSISVNIKPLRRLATTLKTLTKKGVAHQIKNVFLDLLRKRNKACFYCIVFVVAAFSVVV